ncbi:unnamed protein product [Closterium sp. NIES-53]
MDVWGLALVDGTDQERYFLLVVDDYTRYTTVFPLRHKEDVSGVGSEFSSDLLAEFCRDEGIRQSFMLPASPQQNGIAERRIGLIMELNLWPRVSEPETSPTLRWTGKVGDASVFWFYHPRSHRVFSSQDVTFDESVCYYRLHPHASHSVLLAHLFFTAGAEHGGAETEGEDYGGAATGCASTGGADSGGAQSPSGGGAVGDSAGGSGAGQPPQPDLLETLLPQAICAWIVRRGSRGGGGYCPAGAGAASPGGTTGAGDNEGYAGGAGGAAGAGGTRGASGAQMRKARPWLLWLDN